MWIKSKEQKRFIRKTIKGLHILLAEDNELNMEIAEFMFQNEGAEVTKAWNGLEAVEIFEKSRPGRGCDLLPECDVEVTLPQEKDKREKKLHLPELSEIELSRHYTELAKNHMV